MDVTGKDAETEEIEVPMLGLTFEAPGVPWVGVYFEDGEYRYVVPRRQKVRKASPWLNLAARDIVAVCEELAKEKA